MGAAFQAEKMALAQETLFRALQSRVLTEGKPPFPRRQGTGQWRPVPRVRHQQPSDLRKIRNMPVSLLSEDLSPLVYCLLLP